MNHFGQSIRYFIQTVEAGSLTLAATRFGISQSAISQQLNSLEKELAVNLFLKKDKTGILLSPAGEKLYEEGKRILGDFDNLIEEVINLSKSGDQCSLNYGMHIVEDALWLYSNLEERIRYGAPCDRLIRLKGEEKILDKIEENELDGAFFIHLPEKIGLHKGLAWKEAGSYPLRARFSSFSFFANLASVEIEDLSNLILIRNQQDIEDEERFLELLGLSKDFADRKQMRFPSGLDALEEVKNNRGFLFLNPLVHVAEVDGTKDVPISSRGINIELPVYLVWKKRNAKIDFKKLNI